MASGGTILALSLLALLAVLSLLYVYRTTAKASTDPETKPPSNTGSPVPVESVPRPSERESHYDRPSSLARYATIENPTGTITFHQHNGTSDTLPAQSVVDLGYEKSLISVTVDATGPPGGTVTLRGETGLDGVPRRLPEHTTGLRLIDFRFDEARAPAMWYSSMSDLPTATLSAVT